MNEAEDRRINLKQILVTAIVTGIVGVATGMLLFHFQQREPRLTYEVKESLPFIGDKEQLSIHYVVVLNGGKKIVSGVDCHISVSPATVKELRGSAPPRSSTLKLFREANWTSIFPT